MATVFIDSPSEPIIIGSDQFPLQQYHVPVADEGVFDRHQKLPAHQQQRLRDAHLWLVGGGGLGTPAGFMAARGGIGNITVADPDDVEWSNLSRQLFSINDIGKPKAFALARILTEHMVGGGTITGIAMTFEDILEARALPSPVNVIACGVDNNRCRLAVTRWARQHRIPAVHTMVSNYDGQRCVCFLQGPNPADPCLWCASPDMDPDGAAPCDAAAIITGGFLASSFAMFFVHRALMGWPKGLEPFNWREADLFGSMPDVVGRVKRKPACKVCGNL